MNTNSFKPLLIELEAFWQLQNAPILAKFNPGVKYPVKEIDRFTGTLPGEVWDLYCWKNGVSPSSNDVIGNLQIFELGIFMPLEKAIRIQGMNGDPEWGWGSDKFCLFESGGGEYHVVEGNILSDHYGMIYYYSPKAVDHNILISMYDSLYTLFLTIYECFKQGIFVYDSNNYLEIEYERFFDLANALNPRSDYWRAVS